MSSICIDILTSLKNISPKDAMNALESPPNSTNTARSLFSTNTAKSVKVKNYDEYRCSLEADEEALQYGDIINFGRCHNPHGSRNCVMCGRSDVSIPTQNKDVCKNCDSSFWLIYDLQIVVKFCKGEFH
jgi:hypothetical protein